MSKSRKGYSLTWVRVYSLTQPYYQDINTLTLILIEG
jgi:hypothetical protein